MNRIKLAGLATVGALGLSLTGFVGGGVAQADTADDLQVMLGNLPDAVDVLTEKIQTALDNYQANGTLDGLAFDLIIGVGDTAGALGNGTEQFGLLGLGVTLGLAGPYSIIQPFVIAFDNDPASVLQQLDPADVSTILGNVPSVLDALTPEVVALISDLLQGDLIGGTDLFSATSQPGVVGDAFAALNNVLNALFANTDFGNTVPLGVGVPLLVAAVVAAPYVQQAEDALAPLFDALAPVTAPIIDALNGLG